LVTDGNQGKADVVATSWQQVFMHLARKEEKNRQRFLLIKVGFKSTGKKAKLTHV